MRGGFWLYRPLLVHFTLLRLALYARCIGIFAKRAITCSWCKLHYWYDSKYLCGNAAKRIRWCLVLIFPCTWMLLLWRWVNLRCWRSGKIKNVLLRGADLLCPDQFTAYMVRIHYLEALTSTFSSVFWPAGLALKNVIIRVSLNSTSMFMIGRYGSRISNHVIFSSDWMIFLLLSVGQKGMLCRCSWHLFESLCSLIIEPADELEMVVSC